MIQNNNNTWTARAKAGEGDGSSTWCYETVQGGFYKINVPKSVAANMITSYLRKINTYQKEYCAKLLSNNCGNTLYYNQLHLNSSRIGKFPTLAY